MLKAAQWCVHCGHAPPNQDLMTPLLYLHIVCLINSFLLETLGGVGRVVLTLLKPRSFPAMLLASASLLFTVTETELQLKVAITDYRQLSSGSAKGR